MTDRSLLFDRRSLMMSGAAATAALLARSAPQPFSRAAPAKVAEAAVRQTPPITASPAAVQPALVRKALAALRTHGPAITHHDRIGIVDFSVPSSQPRLHFLDVVSGNVSSLLVAHGSGSDPGHTGYLHSFSNTSGSNASSEGAFVTSDYYVGKHGRSQRLVGLDPTNDNALARAIVVHSAWYANPDMIDSHGKLGRSQGCFAVGEQKLDQLFGFLGEGRLLYAAKA